MRDKKKVRNPIVEAMRQRYGQTETVMRDRRQRRPKDARNSWENELED